MLEQAKEDVGQDFIGAVAEEDLFRLYLVVSRNGLAQAFAFRIGIEAQAVVQFGLDGFDDFW